MWKTHKFNRIFFNVQAHKIYTHNKCDHILWRGFSMIMIWWCCNILCPQTISISIITDYSENTNLRYMSTALLCENKTFGILLMDLFFFDYCIFLCTYSRKMNLVKNNKYVYNWKLFISQPINRRSYGDCKSSLKCIKFWFCC